MGLDRVFDAADGHSAIVWSVYGLLALESCLGRKIKLLLNMLLR